MTEAATTTKRAPTSGLAESLSHAHEHGAQGLPVPYEREKRGGGRPVVSAGCSIKHLPRRGGGIMAIARACNSFQGPELLVGGGARGRSPQKLKDFCPFSDHRSNYMEPGLEARGGSFLLLIS